MKTLFPIVWICSCLLAAHSFAGSATWNVNPISNDWSTPANWTPNTVPNGPADVASFGLSNATAVSIQNDIEVASIVFNPGASPFSFTMDAPAFEGGNLIFSGTGITNNSAMSQNFNVDYSGIISFLNAATAGNGTIFTLNYYVEFGGTSTAGTASFVANGAPGPDAPAGGVIFWGSSTAGDATFTLNGATVDYAYGGLVTFANSATAGNGVFVLNGPDRSGPYASTINFAHSSTAGNGIFTLNPGPAYWPEIVFSGSATAGNGTFYVNGGNGENKYGANVFFYGYTGDEPTAGNATFVMDGGDGPNTTGGHMDFSSESTAGQALLIVNGGGEHGGKGGYISFQDTSDGGEAQIELFGNGYLDISYRYGATPSVTIGSLGGDGGLVYLGSYNLTVGSNNLSTAFSGKIREDGGISDGSGGSVTKIGTGTLTLSGANTYTGGTIISAGTLLVKNTAGSATGTGAVQVSSGILGGRGIISGVITIGTGSATGGLLQPGKGASKPATLTLQKSLTFKSDGTYTWKLNTKKAKADQVIANGVTIETGARFDFNTVGNKKLTVGNVFTAISNTTATAIFGTFGNLADGSTVTIGVNKLQVSYSGGDGNDLTLTVVP